MPVTVRCPSGHAFLAPPNFVGREVRCPYCQQMTVVEVAVTRQQPSPAKPPSVGVAGVGEPSAPPNSAQGNPASAEIIDPVVNEVASKVPTARLSVGMVLGLLAVAMSSLIPAALAIAQNCGGRWPTGVVAISALQIGAVFLLVILPDWTSLKIVGLLFGIAAALFGMGAAFLAFAVESRLHAMGIESTLRDAAARWMISLMAIQATTTFLCFRAAETWRRRVSIIFARKPRRATT